MEELWDLYDENRIFLNRQFIRGPIIPEGTYHIVADIWTVNDKGEILITKRHPDKPYGLYWECTGGSVIAGEDSMTGALRELSEEVGIFTKAEELKLIHSARLANRFVDTYITMQEITLEDLRLQPEEVVEAKFVSFIELVELWEEGILLPKERFKEYIGVIEKFMKNNQEITLKSKSGEWNQNNLE